jgi:hypothetical protein
MNGVEPLFFVGVLHFHLWVRPAKLACGVNGGKEGMNNHLNRLALQSKAAFGGFLQLLASWPLGMCHSGLFMCLHAAIPDPGRLLLSGFQSAELTWRQVVKSIDAHAFHGMMIA